MKRAIIVINAYTKRGSELNQPRRLQEELASLGVEAEIVRNSPAVLRAEADFAIYLDKDKYAARALERRMRMFNSAAAIETCDDKMLTHLALAGFPMPETISSLLCYTPEAATSADLLGEAEARLGYPMIVKENFGSLGAQVYLAEDRRELEELSERLKLRPYLYQKFIAESRGRDVRAICVGGDVVCAMKRTSPDFRSNLSLGGKGEIFEPTEEIRSLCARVCAAIGLDYCGIDLLFGKEGMLVCEVNSNAFFGGIEAVTGVNVAATYARYIFHEVYGSAPRK